jgi:LmbE family N-acetylglucosaminyl deacetylase
MARDDKHQLMYPKFGVVVVAQPSDEALWAGGMILLHSEANWTILSLCGGQNPDMKEKFIKAAEIFGAEPIIGDFHVDTEELPSQFQVQKEIAKLMFSERFDVIVTHAVWGEYQHIEMASITAKSVLNMTRTGQFVAKQILQFAYEKKQESHLITPVQEADIILELDKDIIEKKFEIITDIYGFSQDTLEVKSISDQETFWLLGQKSYQPKRRQQKT